MGKDDAETVALKKELEDLINKCKVVLIQMLHYSLKEKENSSEINPPITLTQNRYFANQEDQKKQQDTTLEEACNGVADAPKVKLTTKKMLKGHINKVNSVHFSGDSRSV